MEDTHLAICFRQAAMRHLFNERKIFVHKPRRVFLFSALQNPGGIDPGLNTGENKQTKIQILGTTKPLQKLNQESLEGSRMSKGLLV